MNVRGGPRPSSRSAAARSEGASGDPPMPDDLGITIQILLMDFDRTVRCRDGEVSVRVVAVVLGQWRDCRGRYREVAKKHRVSSSYKREGHVIGIRHAWRDRIELVHDRELMLLSIGRGRRERGK